MVLIYIFFKNILRDNNELGYLCKINVNFVWSFGKMGCIFAIPIRKTSSIVVDIGTYKYQRLFS